MPRRRRRLLAALSTALAVVAAGLGITMLPTPSAAAPPAPVILNNGAQNSGNAQWVETQAQPDEGGASVKQFWATFLVKHAVGRTINRVSLSGPGVNSTFNVTGQTYVAAAGGIETSRVTVAIPIGSPGGFSCPFLGGATRARDATVTMRVIDSTNEQSAAVSATVKFIEDDQCLARQDYPRLTSASQNKTEVVPGETITYTFTCDDVDGAGSDDDECNRARIRWRRLDDGSTSANTTKTGMSDNSTQTHTMSFPSQGYYVVEAQLGNENGDFPQTGGASQGWFRLGNAVVNDPASSLSGSLAFTGVVAGSPPSVNQGSTVNAVATVADSGGDVQVIEWDATNDGSFERREYTVPTLTSGDVVHPDLSAAQRTQSVSTSTPGTKTVRARITDNGALDAADNIRRQLTFSAQVRVNAIPTAANVSRTVAEDSGPTVITLAGSDADSWPEPLKYHLVSGLSNPSLGTLSAISGNQITFTPAANAFGTATFTYRVRDGSDSTNAANAFSNTATVSLTVTPVNDAPTVTAPPLTTAEDTPGSVTVTGSDVEDGTNLTFTVDSQPTNGTASCTSAGVCTYTPDENFFGADSFVVRGTDTGTLSSTATVEVTVTPVNDAPVADDKSVTVVEDDTAFPILLTASDVDDGALGFTPLDGVEHGTLSCLGDSCTYTPDPDYNGPDSFTFEVTDSGGASDVGTVEITVTPVNDAPVAIDVAIDALEDQPTAVPTQGTDVDGDTVTVDSATDPANGTTTLNPPDEVTYLGDPHFHGVDTFEFTVVDGNGGSDVGTATVTVLPVNDLPVVDDQAFTVTEDTPALLSIVAGDVDGDLLGWTITSGPANGSLVGTGPDVVYVPNQDFHGTDSFTVAVDDGNGGTDTALITVTVDPVNDQPVADALTVTTPEDTAVAITLAGSDVDGDALVFTAPVSGPTDGTVSCAGVDCTYTPDPDFHGSDQFTFVVDDGNGGNDSASVSITVTSVNDPPVAEGATITTLEDAAVAVSLVAVDPDGDELTYTYGLPADGTVTGSGPDAVYTPNPNFHGTDAFGFTVDDGNGGTDSATIEIVVTSVNDAPVATGGSVTTEEDTTTSFTLGGADAEDDPLTFAVTDVDGPGALTCAPDGTCTFDPEPDFSGVVAVSYEVSDGVDTATGVFTIVVDPVNDPPTASTIPIITLEDTPAGFSLVASDPEGDPLTFAVVSPPSSGTVECSADGSCAYTPAPNQSGTDSFTWSVSDGGAPVTADVLITIVPVNDAPQALDLAAETVEDVPVSVTLLADDVEGDPVTFSIDTAPAQGTATIAGDVLTYTPAPDWDGTDELIYRATDPSGASTTARVTIVVDQVPLLDTSLDAEAVVARITLGGGLNVIALDSMRATLTDAAGLPVVGRTLTFRIGGNVVCSAVTDADGEGACGGSLVGLRALLNLGYEVTFAGDADHAGSSAKGSIVQLLSLRLF